MYSVHLNVCHLRFAVYMYTYLKYILLCTYIYISINLHMCIYFHILYRYMYIYIYVHVYMHMYMYLNILSFVSVRMEFAQCVLWAVELWAVRRKVMQHVDV